MESSTSLHVDSGGSRNFEKMGGGAEAVETEAVCDWAKRRGSGRQTEVPQWGQWVEPR